MDSSSSSVAKRYCYNPNLRWNPQVEEYFIKAYGADHFTRISEALTRPSCYSCIRVNILKSTNEAVIEKLTRLLQGGTVDDLHCLSIGKQVSASTAGDVGLREESIDCMFNLLLEETPKNGRKPMKLLKDPSICQCRYAGLDHVLFVKGSGPHSIHYGNQPDQSVKEVIVSRKCAEAVLRGAQIFVPGLLACSSHVEKGDIVAVSVAVEQPSADGGWGVGLTRGTVLQGSEADPQYLERNGMYIGQGITKFSRAGMFRASEGIAVEMTDRVYRLPSFHNLLEGEIFLQNLPSIVAAHVLDPQQGERILDMCAAPGGKTTAIAMLMRDNGEVIAIDRSHNKVMDIKKLAAEMDLTCIRAYRLDALKSVSQTVVGADVVATNLDREIYDITIMKSSSRLDNGDMHRVNMDRDKIDAEIMSMGNRGNGRYVSKKELRKPTQMMKNGPGRNHSIGGRAENSKGFLPNSFDRVLLDAPCSALGLRPRLFAAEETMESLQTHAKYQRKMFDQAVQLVRTGGVIVYSTCTINPGENEALVRYALDTYKFLSLAPQNPKVGGPGLVGKCELFGGKHAETWLTQSEAELVQRFDPSATLDTIGFFIAKFNVGQK
ncbi:hypothetical protein KFK09_004142 [Dendrobium nobile]|uniref:SAM-dependent MTase RsmB/NOP-type domain-containing protein n=1 Tax=Dendrobium nobile TaxID=94219 RepID=A0A8T3C4Z4_DENNO|nr:hypothetical protein KFK09_004142 [Dendrobium nobile]